MNQERIFISALLVLAVLASIPQIPVDAQIWGVILVVVGIVGGVITNYEDLSQRLIVYVVAVALPVFSNSLDAIWVVGPWVNTLLDNVAIGLQGTAVGLFAMGMVGRLTGPTKATEEATT